MERRYLESHPWISFDLRGVNAVGQRLWMLMGEAKSKCEHLAGAPLLPDVAAELNHVTLLKGAQATTAIEGNTLSIEQVEGILDGTFSAPPSRRYQEIEVRNVLDALQAIDQGVLEGEYLRLTPEKICEFNALVLEGLEQGSADGTVPGQLRTHSVVVGRYRGAPPEDCSFLLERLCEWLEGDQFRHEDPAIDFALMLMRAVMAHLYLAWIHPFGDGNGRTARLVEYLILARSGKVPLPAAHLLSNHYNLTRDQYYRELDRTSRLEGGSQTYSVSPFITYAVEGFVDGIRTEIDTVRAQQVRFAWQNFVHKTMGKLPPSKAVSRQLELALAMPARQWLSRDDAEFLTPGLARQYAKAGPRMVARDLNRLVEQGLMRRKMTGTARYQVRVDLMEAFMPAIAQTGGPEH